MAKDEIIIEEVVKEKQFNITFMQNRSFDLHIRHTVYHFEPNETKTVNEFVINHPDFKQQEKLFNITEVK